ncbi:MAG TPA: CinA family nicotinamide mononucleotide deamidase-related protein [Desulfatiglandales bacterium]|nr:CinA family nicotinamide mononucleotide deamidase-related protein [Desulfatiglandales bacterium]
MSDLRMKNMGQGGGKNIGAEIITVGTELLLGQIVDTNSTWIAEKLASVGVNLFYRTAVGDNLTRMEDIFRRALKRSQVIIVTGGIGPTEDDRTREIAALVTDRKLKVDPGLLRQITERFRSRGFIMSSNNEKQAQIPAGSIPVENPNGTAPAFIVEHEGSVLICLPGVPFEMKYLVEHRIIPYLRKTFNLSGGLIKIRVLKTCGLGESAVDDKISDLMAKGTNPTVGVLAHPGQVDIRIAVKGNDEATIDRMLDEMADVIGGRLGVNVFGRDGESIEDVVGLLVRKAGVTIVSVENLTGGLVSQRLLSACGDRFCEGAVVNTEDSVRRLLKACAIEALNRFQTGADEVLDHRNLSRLLAEAVTCRSGADVGLAVMCFPEPDEKVFNLSLGETFIILYDGKEFKDYVLKFGGRGSPDQLRASMYALDTLRRYLMNLIEPLA